MKHTIVFNFNKETNVVENNDIKNLSINNN